MVKMTRVASVAMLGVLALGICLFAALSPAQAKTTSDQPAAILYWPRVVVDSTGALTTIGGVATPTDTLIRLSNTATLEQKQAHCFYIDANSHCSNSPSTICQSSGDCVIGGIPGDCNPGWSEIDFDVILTKDQPLAWFAGSGLRRGEFPLETPGFCALLPTRVCTSDAECPTGCVPSASGPLCNCVKLQSNLGSGIPPVPEDPFVGSLECIEYVPATGVSAAGPDQTPTSNTLKGEASIEGTQFLGSRVDIAEYNAVGVKFRSVEGGLPADELHLDGVEYDTCPTTLILDHLFDIPEIDQITDLTLIPCGNDFLTQTPGEATAQFVVFNEFEQRFSTSKGVDCFLETPISSLDTTDPTRSIFSAGVAGTLGGQTRIRPVGTATTGRGLVGVAWYRTDFGTSAYNLHQAGSPVISPPAGSGTQPDIITIP